MEHENDILVCEKLDTDLFETTETPSEESILESAPVASFPTYDNKKPTPKFETYQVVQTFSKNQNKPKKENSEFNQLVRENSSFEPSIEQFTYKKTDYRPKFKLKSSAKFFLFTCATIAVLLTSLLIYNAVSINNLQRENFLKQQEITESEAQLDDINKLIKDLGKIDQTDAENGGYENVENEVEIALNKPNTLPEYQTKTSFFDMLCNFISSLFGG